MPNPIGQRIREVRIAYGMSQVELARRLGITRQLLNNIEQERSMPLPPLIAQIATILQVNGNYLLGLSDNKDIPALGCRGVMASLLKPTITPA